MEEESEKEADICTSCLENIDGPSIGCDGPCAGWVHLSCAGLTQQEADTMTAYKCLCCKASTSLPRRPSVSEWPLEWIGSLEESGPLDTVMAARQCNSVDIAADYDFDVVSDSEEEEKNVDAAGAADAAADVQKDESKDESEGDEEVEGDEDDEDSASDLPDEADPAYIEPSSKRRTDDSEHVSKSRRVLAVKPAMKSASNLPALVPLKLFDSPLICGELETHNFHCDLKDCKKKRQEGTQRKGGKLSYSSRAKIGGERPNIPADTTVFLRAAFVRMLPLKNVTVTMFTAPEAKRMSQVTGLSSIKIVRWFANNRKRYFEAHESALLRLAHIRHLNRDEKSGRACFVLEQAMARMLWPKKYADPKQEETAMFRRLTSAPQRG
jgi:hypothetical protein